jgi:hypothetical protein
MKSCLNHSKKRANKKNWWKSENHHFSLVEITPFFSFFQSEMICRGCGHGCQDHQQLLGRGRIFLGHAGATLSPTWSMGVPYPAWDFHRKSDIEAMAIEMP